MHIFDIAESFPIGLQSMSFYSKGAHFDIDETRGHVVNTKVWSFKIDNTHFTEAAAKWLLKSGILSSPALTSVWLANEVSPTCILLDAINAPNLRTLTIENLDMGPVLDVIARHPSLSCLVFRGDTSTTPASKIVECIEAHKGLANVTIFENTFLSDNIVTWAMSKWNTHVNTVMCELSVDNRGISKSEFFQHPVLTTLVLGKEWQGDINIYAMRKVKEYMKKFIWSLHPAAPTYRLPSELAAMVFDVFVKMVV